MLRYSNYSVTLSLLTFVLLLTASCSSSLVNKRHYGSNMYVRAERKAQPTHNKHSVKAMTASADAALAYLTPREVKSLSTAQFENTQKLQPKHVVNPFKKIIHKSTSDVKNFPINTPDDKIITVANSSERIATTQAAEVLPGSSLLLTIIGIVFIVLGIVFFFLVNIYLGAILGLLGLVFLLLGFVI